MDQVVVIDGRRDDRYRIHAGLELAASLAARVLAQSCACKPQTKDNAAHVCSPC
jgi:hypothetical protein